MNICQECGVNTALARGHSLTCSQYIEPVLTDSQLNALYGFDDESTEKIQIFSDALNDAAVERGERMLETFMRRIGMNAGDPGYDEMKMVMRMSLAVGAGTAVHVMIEQDLIDEDALRRAAGV